MDLALYWPNGGYYRGPSPTGATGDFYTAPGAHPAFGALLCLQLYQMWRLLNCPNPFWVVEAGAGNAILSRDIVNFAPSLPHEFHCSLQYLCLDTSPTIAYDGAGVQPIATDRLPLSGIVGCILSNELLDAFPVHMVEKRDGRLLEVYVTLRDDKFVENLDEPSTPALQRRLDALDVKLADGQRAEINLAMTSWLADAARSLNRGYLLTIDYGRKASELYSPSRFRGTLTTFYRHTQTDNPYVHVGRQDITAQVDFTTLQRLGKKFGLTNLAYLTQAPIPNQPRPPPLDSPPPVPWTAAASARRQSYGNAATHPSRRHGRLQSPHPGQKRPRSSAVGPSTLLRVGRPGATAGATAPDRPPRPPPPSPLPFLWRPTHIILSSPRRRISPSYPFTSECSPNRPATRLEALNHERDVLVQVQLHLRRAVDDVLPNHVLREPLVLELLANAAGLQVVQTLPRTHQRHRADEPR